MLSKITKLFFQGYVLSSSLFYVVGGLSMLLFGDPWHLGKMPAVWSVTALGALIGLFVSLDQHMIP